LGAALQADGENEVRVDRCVYQKLDSAILVVQAASLARPFPATTSNQIFGTHNKPTAPASPWQNGFAERLIRSIRRECVDHIVVLGEARLRRILRAYAGYYNDIRTHRSLDKDAPVSRSVQRTRIISSRPILGGLHHHYVRV